MNTDQITFQMPRPQLCECGNNSFKIQFGSKSHPPAVCERCGRELPIDVVKQSMNTPGQGRLESPRPNIPAIAAWLEQLKATKVTFAVDEPTRALRVEVVRPSDKMELFVSLDELRFSADADDFSQHAMRKFERAFGIADESRATPSVTG